MKKRIIAWILTFMMVIGGVPAYTEEVVVESPAIVEQVSETETAGNAEAVEEPAAEEPTVEETAVEEPAAEEPTVEEPAAEEPAVEEPAAEEPAAEEPAVEEPAVEEPAAEETVTEEEEVPSADDFTLMASEKLSFTMGYAYLSQNNARVYKAENDEEAYAYLSKGVVYAISRSNAGGSIDRIRFAFATEDGVEEMYVSAARLRPMSDEEIDAFKAEIEDTDTAEIHYYADAYPVDVLEMTLAAAEPETEEPAVEPTPVEPETEEPAAEPTPAEPEAEATASEPVPVEPEVEATETEPVPVEPEAEATQSEPVPVEPEAEATESEPVPVEPEAEATESEPVPVEPEAEATESEPVPVEPETIVDNNTFSGNDRSVIDFTGTRNVIGVGERINISALVNGAAAEFTYSSDDTSVAVVDASGEIMGIDTGRAVITVTAPGGESDSFTLTVKDAPSVIVFDEPSLMLGEEAVHQIKWAFEGDAAGLVTWFSANEEIVTVDANGVLTAKGVGATAVQARAYNGVSATCSVTVMAEPTDILLSVSSAEMNEGEEMNLAAFFTGDAFGKVTFAASGDGEVEIIDNGDNTAVIKALKSGSVTVTAAVFNALKNETFSADLDLTINTAIVRIELNNARDTIGYKETVDLDPVAYDGRGNIVETTFKYESSSTKYITIKGESIYGAYKGSAKVRVTAENGVSVTVSITVAAAPTKVTVSADSMEIAVGEGTQAYAEFPDGQAGKVEWRVEDATILSIDDSGYITALKKGTTRVRADAYNGKYGIATITVVDMPRSIAFEKASYQIGEGESFKPVLKVTPADAAIEPVFEILEEGLALVSEDGTVTAQTTLGTFTLVAKVHNAVTDETLTAQCEIEIVPAPVTIELENARTEIGRKETVTLSPVAYDGRGNRIETAFKLASSNTRYVSVSGMNVYGAAKGEAVVTVTAANGVKTQLHIEVVTEPSKVMISAESEVLSVGAVMQLTAEFPFGQMGAVTWRVEDGSILSIDDNGMVAALKKGETRVRADSYNGKYGLITLTVSDAPEAIAFEKAAYQLGEGGTMKPVLIAEPEGACAIASYEIISGEELASVNMDGSVTAGTTLGTLVLRATVHDYEKDIDVTAECEIEIVPAPVTIELIGLRTEIGYTETVPLNPVAYDGRGNVIATNFKASSSNTRYVSIKNSGIYGAGKGTAVITVSAENGVETQVSITTLAAPTRVEIEAPSDKMTISETMVLTPEFPDKQGGGVSWRVEDDQILSIDENGVVTALKEGSTRVRVDTYNKKYALITISVYPAPNAIAFKEDQIELAVGMEIEPELVLSPASAYVNPVFTFENEAVGDQAIEIDGESIIGKNAGSGVLTVSFTCLDGTVLTDSCEVVVKPEPSKIVLDIDRFEIGLGEIVNINPVAYDDDGNVTIAEFSLSTSSKSYIQVRDTEIYGAKKGSAKITVTAHNGVSLTTTFKVVSAPSTITVTADDMAISQTGSTEVHAAFGSGKAGSVTWASSDERIAVVDENGIVIAKAIGRVTITATSYNGETGSITLEVKSEPTGIAFDESEAIVGEDGSKTITARLPEDCAGSITYSAANPYIVSVDPETGCVTGLRQGSTTVTATTINNVTGECFTASYELTVTPKPVKIVLNIGRDEIGLKEIADLEAVAYDEFGNETDGALTFESSRTAYVDINEKGQIYGAKRGYSDITVTAYNGVSVKVRFTTVYAPTSVKLDKKSVVISEMDEITLDVKTSSGSASGFTWTSSDENVVTVDKKGVIKAVQYGSAIVSVETFNGKKASCEVIVKYEPTSIAFENDQEKVGEGNSRTITAMIPEECIGEITYSSSVPAIASVDANTGKVAGLKKGTVTITASTTNRLSGETFTDSYELTVTAKPAEIEINVARVKIGVGETLALDAVAYDADGNVTDGGFTYATSRKAYVTVDEAGNLYGVRAGYSDITVKTYNGVSTKGRITVVKAPTAVSVSQSSIRISELDTYQLSMKLSEGSVGAYTWLSSDENVCVVDQNGLVTAKGFGTADVIVTTYNGKSAVCEVKVLYEPVSVTFPEDVVSVGELSNITVKAELGDDYMGEIEYISGNESIAVVDAETGVVTGVRAGNTTIIAKTVNRKTGEEITAILTVIVTPAPARVEILTKVNKIGLKETVTIKAVTYDAAGNVIDGQLKLSTSNSRYIQVNSMMQMYGAKRGSATIGVVAYNGVFASMKVDVASAPASINLNYTTLDLIVGEDPVQLQAILPSGTGSMIKWETENNDTSIATVDENGFVTPVAYGTIRVRAVTFNGKYKMCTVNVFEAPKSVTLSDEKIVLGEEQTYTLTASVNEFAAGKITFTSSAEAIATVDEDGKVTAVKEGRATITAETFNGKTDTCEVIVKKAPSKVEFTVSSITIGVKQDVDVTNLVKIPEGTMASFTFVSEKAAIAKITPEGVLTGVKVGSTRIKVTTHNGVYAILPVEVKSAPTTLTLIIGNPNLYVGQTSEYMVQLPDGMVSEYTITSSAPEVVRVDTENRQLVAVSKGQAVITAQAYNGVVKTQVVNVLQHVESITLDREAITLVHYETDQLIATLLPEDASDLSVNWISSDPEKVSVDENGRIAALEVTEEPVTITARTRDMNLSASCEVTVTPVRVTGIELNVDEITLEKGRMVPMLVTITPDNADNRNLIWESSNEALVTVDEHGVVTAVAHEGTAKVTVTSVDGDFTDECIIHLSRIRMRSMTVDAFRTIVHYDTYQLAPSFTPRDAEYESIFFESTNEAAVKVSQTGLLEAVNVGTSVIKVTVVDYFGVVFNAECAVAVVPVPVTDVTLSMDALEIRAGKTAEITVSVLPDNAFNKQIRWTSANEDAAIVTVDPANNHKATITAISGGEALITAASLDSGVSDSLNVVVFDALGASLTANHNANTIGNTLVWTAEALNAIGDVSYSFKVVKDDATAVINMTGFSDENTIVIENATAGVYTATVTVKDGLGDMATATCTISVQASQLFVSGNDTFSYVIMPGAAADGGDGAAIKYADPSTAPANVRIPAYIDGMPVVRIDTEAFMNATKLITVSVPDTVTVIGARAFKGCTSLTDMDSYSAE